MLSKNQDFKGISGHPSCSLRMYAVYFRQTKMQRCNEQELGKIPSSALGVPENGLCLLQLSSLQPVLFISVLLIFPFGSSFF